MRARDNPFRSERVEALRYRSAEGCGGEDLLERLAALDYRAAIVGAEGSGKTTLQEELAEILAGEGLRIRWLRLHRDNRREGGHRVQTLCADVRPEELIFVDGAEQLGRLTWRRLVRRSAECRGVVATLHRPGRLPTLVECRTTPNLLRSLVAELVPEGACRLDAVLDEQFSRHGGNLRLCLRELYDRWAALSPG